MRVICISGKAQHGKDTTAKLMKEYLEDSGQSVLIAHYADLVKYVCKTFFDWDGQKDENGRHLLQYVGTDVVRTKRPSFWVDFIIDILNLFGEKWDYVLIPDCRFPNEIDVMKKNGFDVTSVRIVRTDFTSPLTTEQQQHPSETALDSYSFDYTIYNGGQNIDSLRHAVIHLFNDGVL